MKNLSVPTSWQLRTSVLLALAVLSAGCETLRKTPQVDVVPVTPVRYAAAPAATAPASGSLFHAASYRPAFEDPRARLPGDTLTIQISENITASQKSSANIDRSGEASASVSALPFLKALISARGDSRLDDAYLRMKAKKMAKETHAVRLRVSTSSDNQVAQKTYESIGFREDTEFKNYTLPISED